MLALGAVFIAALMFGLSGHGWLAAQPVTEAVHPAPTSKTWAAVSATATVPASASTVSKRTVLSVSTGVSTGPLDAVPPSAVEQLRIPVVGVDPGDLVDSFTDARNRGRVHDAIDIVAARGTPVVAANDGHVVKLFTSVRGGLTVYQFDPQDQVVYYYAHLESYAPGLTEGQVLHRGDLIGRVGSTGNASVEAPHLHFEVGILGPKKRWWHATSINPYGRFAGQP